MKCENKADEGQDWIFSGYGVDLGVYCWSSNVLKVGPDDLGGLQPKWFYDFMILSISISSLI